jgi:flagellin-like hook-associated protein FlgL
MPLGVLNNISAVYAENNLNQTQASLQTTLQQLSSGSRINSGADDAAGLSIADGLQANSSALTQSSAGDEFAEPGCNAGDRGRRRNLVELAAKRG